MKGMVRELFRGKVSQDALVPLGTPLVDEQETVGMVVDSVRKFLAGKTEELVEFDRVGAQSTEFLQELRELGLFSLIIPEQFNGLSLSSFGYARVLQEIATFDASTGLTIGAHSSIGMKALLLFGSDEQQQRYLSRLATGELIAAFCLTESGAGSDAAAITTTANQREDGAWVLNGEKIWITNGPIADFFTVFVRTGEAGTKGISCFIVERGWEGVNTGPKEEKMGIRASLTSTVSFQNVVVAPEFVIGEIGEGFKIAMAVLNSGRTGLGGGCVGAMKRCLALAYAHAAERRQFGEHLMSFQMIQEKLTRMTMRCVIAESLVHYVATLIESGCDDYSLEAAVCKIVSTECLWEVAFEGLQIAGGNGFMKEYPYEMIVRDSRINLIFEGTNEILRNYVALSGIKVVGDKVGEVKSVLGQGFAKPYPAMCALLQLVAPSLVSSCSTLGAKGFAHLPPELRRIEKRLFTNVQRFAVVAQKLATRHRRSIIHEQLQLGRLADCVCSLLTAYVVLARAHQYGRKDSNLNSIALVVAHEANTRVGQLLAATNDNVDKEQLGILKGIEAAKGYPFDLFFD